MGGGLPVLRRDEYIMRDIIAGMIGISVDNRADVQVRTVKIANHSIREGEDIDAATRFEQVRTVWQERSKLPEELPVLIERHEVLVRGGNQISIDGRMLIRDIQRATAQASREMEVGWATAITDPLPTLLAMVGFALPEPPPIPIEQIPHEIPEIRRREMARQRRLATARGADSARFRREVRNAYRARCLVCGLRLPALWAGGRTGVDSAHILPDSEFDLNHVSNGLCLCKLHHWAFDEGLIEIIYDSQTDSYSVIIPDQALARANGPPVRIDVAFLRPHLGLIPQMRLPADSTLRPNPECLRRLHELLYP